MKPRLYNIAYNKMLINYFLLIGFFLISDHSYSQEAYVLVNGVSHYESVELLTDQGFKYKINIPASNQCNVEIEIVFPSYVEFLSMGNDQFQRTVVSGNTQSFQNANPLGEDNDFEINLSLKTNDVCENLAEEILATTTFDNSSCQNINNNAIIITPKYSQEYTHRVSVGNEEEASIGNFIIYNIELPKLLPLGGFQLFEPNVEVDIKGGNYLIYEDGELRDDIELLNTSGSNSCSKTLRWNINNSMSVLGNVPYKAKLIVFLDCECYEESENLVPLDVRISGLDPCEPANNIQSSYTQNHLVSPIPNYEVVERNCDEGGEVNVTFDKRLNKANFIDLCPGSCYDYSYSILFSNANGPYVISDLSIEDDIPDNIIVNRLSMPSFLEFCYTTSDLPDDWNCLVTAIDIPQYINISNDANSSAQLILPSGSVIDKLKFNQSQLDAFSSLGNIQMNFTIKDGTQSLEDNTAVATFSANNTPYSISDDVSHGSMRDCSSYHNINNQVKRRSDDFFSGNINCNTLEIIRYALVIENLGTGNLPPADIEFVLPIDFEFLGNESYQLSTSPYHQMVQTNNPLPAGVTVSVGPEPNKVVVSGLVIEPRCESLGRTIIEFDARVGQFALSKNHSLIVDISPGRSRDNAKVFVNTNYSIDANTKFRCIDSEIVESNVDILQNQNLDLILEISNSGNVELQNIIITYNLPALDGLEVNSDMAVQDLGSDFSLEYSDVPIVVTGGNVSYHFSNDYSDFCDFPSSVNSSYQANSVLKIMLEEILIPGTTSQILIKHSSPSSQLLNDIAYSNFFFCGERTDITEVDGSYRNESSPAGTLSLTISEETNCPPPPECELDEVFYDRMPENFEIVANGNTVEVTCNDLTMNDTWFPLWGDNTSGGSSYFWGSGTYPSSHAYAESGTYEICINIESYRTEANNETDKCHCKILCQEITIGSDTGPCIEPPGCSFEDFLGEYVIDDDSCNEGAWLFSPVTINEYYRNFFDEETCSIIDYVLSEGFHTICLTEKGISIRYRPLDGYEYLYETVECTFSKNN